MSENQPKPEPNQPSESSPGEGEKPIQRPEPGIKQFVTRLTPIEQQVGTHVISALQQGNTVAVLTTVMAGQEGSQHIVSVGLDQGLLDQVGELLQQTNAEESSRVPCVGFQCFLPKKENE